MTNFVKDSSDAMFITDVIEESKSVPVLVDFWAPWCGPCRTLGPLIEKAVNGFGGMVKLVKINVDENPHFSGQLRVQSIPAVFAFKNGKVIDNFMGALPETSIRAFIDKVIGPRSVKSIDEKLTEAKDFIGQNDIGAAVAIYAEILEKDDINIFATVGLARAYIKAGDFEKAEHALNRVPPEKNYEISVKSAKAQLQMTQELKDIEAPNVFLEKLRIEPENLAIRFDYACSLASTGEFEGAISELFKILETELDWENKKARNFLLKIFDVLDANDERTKKGRRKLSSLLFA